MSGPEVITAGAGAVVAMSLIMMAAFVMQQRSGNSGWVDTIWPLGTGGVSVGCTLIGTGGATWRQLAIALLAAAWSIRLALHIGARARSRGDDPRYRQLTRQWGAKAPRRMFWFLQSQAAVGALLAVAVALAGRNPVPALRVQDAVGLLILAAAMLGEAVADRQLRRFRRERATPGEICDVGLWRWSRHPNYFFEWLAWLAYPVVAIDLGGDHPFGYLAAAAPLCMYWVLVHASGIPPLEAHMLRTRGERYREYQRRTRPFLPLPLRR